MKIYALSHILSYYLIVWSSHNPDVQCFVTSPEHVIVTKGPGLRIILLTDDSV